MFMTFVYFLVSKALTKELPFNLEALPSKTLKLKWLLYQGNIFNIKYLFKRLKTKLILPNFQKGHLITIMGVDGSGKSTALVGLEEFVNRYYNSDKKVEVIYMGSQGGYSLPIDKLAKLKNKLLNKKVIKQSDSTINNAVKANAPRHNNSISISFFIKCTLITIEYLMRLAKIHYLTKVKRKIVLTDRYVYDVAREGVDLNIVSLLAKLFPKPTRTFLMKGDVAEFFRRKGEYSVKELGEHQDALEKHLVTQLDDKLTIIDADLSEKEVLSQILQRLSIESSGSH